MEEMYVSKIGKDGRVNVPQEIRERLHLVEGKSYVAFILTNDPGIVVVKKLEVPK